MPVHRQDVFVFDKNIEIPVRDFRGQKDPIAIWAKTKTADDSATANAMAT
jgi:hypothetical protein